MGTPFKMKGSPMQRNFGIGGSPVRDMKTWTAQEMQGKNPPYVAKELHNDKHKRKEVDSDHKSIEKKPPLTLKNSPARKEETEAEFLARMKAEGKPISPGVTISEKATEQGSFIQYPGSLREGGGATVAGSSQEHVKLRQIVKDRNKKLTAAQRARLAELNALTEKAYKKKIATERAKEFR